ncbi:putative plant self-incompatibility S1 [Lupinus albus]|uniref:S-protein homolog n=1 Tax=Lupinus albus TaxID=3870 RepID=A0A6A4PHJ7_LUPAL|nr:putative plant self-incompatibility S1 [Lupinus albus]
MVGSSSHTLLFPLLLLFASLVAGWSIFTYRHIYIKNDLENNTNLLVHCHSIIDYIDVHTLKYEEEFKFKFQPNFVGNTNYIFSLKWDRESFLFDAYNSQRDGKRCKDCKWSIQKDQPCRFNFGTQKYDICDYSYRLYVAM